MLPDLQDDALVVVLSFLPQRGPGRLPGICAAWRALDARDAMWLALGEVMFGRGGGGDIFRTFNAGATSRRSKRLKRSGKDLYVHQLRLRREHASYAMAGARWSE